MAEVNAGTFICTYAIQNCICIHACMFVGMYLMVRCVCMYAYSVIDSDLSLLCVYSFKNGMYAVFTCVFLKTHIRFTITNLIFNQ